MYPRYFQYTPLRYRPKPLSPGAKLAKVRKIRAAFAKYLASDPQHAIEHANAAFDEANRAEREQMPVSL